MWFFKRATFWIIFIAIYMLMREAVLYLNNDPIVFFPYNQEDMK